MIANEQFFSVVLFIMLYEVVFTFQFADEILKCDYSNESFWAVHSFGNVSYAVQVGSVNEVLGWNPKVLQESTWIDGKWF